MAVIQAFILVVVVGLIYFIPSFIANSNKKQNLSAILVLNIFLGWTVIGWIIALVWATMKDKR